MDELYLQPNAQTDVINSTMNRHEKLKLTISRIVSPSSQLVPLPPCSHLNSFKVKSIEIQ
jgi:hypothetical protein